MNMNRFGLGSGALLLLVVAGCGGSSGSSSGSTGTANSPAAAAAAATVMVIPDPATIGAFTPPTVTLKAGDTVQWAFQDGNPHTATSDTGTFSSLPLTKGKTYSYKFAKAGTYKYHCSIHPEMMGTVTVN